MLQRLYGTGVLRRRPRPDAHLAQPRGGREARPPQARPASSDLFTLRGRGPRLPVLPAQRHAAQEPRCIDYWREIHHKAGYVEISTPLIMLNQPPVGHRSGHWDHYKGQHVLPPPSTTSRTALKPMNCPGGVLVYASLAPAATVTCRMRAGELGIGAPPRAVAARCTACSASAASTQDDAHLFVTPRPARPTRSRASRKPHRRRVLSTSASSTTSSCPPRPDDSHRHRRAVGGRRPSGLEHRARRARHGPTSINEGDGAFYGPKIDFHLEDSASAAPGSAAPIQLDYPDAGSASTSSTSAADGDEAPPGHAPPRVLRLGRALHRHPHRALRGQVPRVAGSHAGEGPVRVREEPRLRAPGCREARRGRHPRGRRRPRREDRLQDPRGPQHRPRAVQ